MEYRQTRSMTKIAKPQVMPLLSEALDRLSQLDHNFIGYKSDGAPYMMNLAGRRSLRPRLLHFPSDWGSLKPGAFGGKRDPITALSTICAAEHCRGLSPHMIRMYLTVGSPFKGEYLEIVESISSGARKLFAAYHRAAFSFFATGVANTWLILGHHYLDGASKKDLHVLWERLFDPADYRVTKAMLGLTLAVVDLENIIDGPQSAQGSPIRPALRHMFVLAAQAICARCSSHPEQATRSQREAWYAAWEMIPPQEGIKSVWTLEDLPVRP